MIVAIIDAEANFLIVKSYEYTTILSIMLCDAMCIPTVVLIALLFLHSKFHWKHYLAVFLCLFGLAIMIFQDWKKSAGEGTHRVVGDLMALGASVLYAVSNTCQEVLVKHDDWKEFLGMIGIGGSVIAAVQLVVFEGKTLLTMHWEAKIVLLLLGYVVALLGMYVITAVGERRRGEV